MFPFVKPMQRCDCENHQKLVNSKCLTDEGKIEVKREPVPYTMQSRSYSYSNTATLAEG